MTISDLLIHANQEVDHLDAELLLAHILRQSREYIVTHPRQRLSLWQTLRYRRLVNKRKKRVPIAYLTGHKAFYGLDFFVSKHTLVPRPETELLVEEALKKITRPITLVDIGTGSGCIPIAIMTATKQEHVRAFGTDISKEALEVARKNAKRHGVNMNFLQGNLLEPVAQIPGALVITANLPYLTQEQCDAEPSIQHEPCTALEADNNGLALYEALLLQLTVMPGRPIHCVFEIDPSQSAAMRALINELFPTTSVSVKKDLAGHDRLISFSLLDAA